MIRSLDSIIKIYANSFKLVLLTLTINNRLIITKLALFKSTNLYSKKIIRQRLITFSRAYKLILIIYIKKGFYRIIGLVGMPH